MSAVGRMALFLAGAAGLAALLWAALAGLPPAGSGGSAYGRLLVRTAVAERHTTDVVAALTYDHRGFDTLGEESILFAAVLGVALLLRASPAERDRPEADRESLADRPVGPPGDAVRLLGVVLVGPTVVFGLYLAAHGQVSPGGGFQGGAVLGTAPLVVFLATGARVLVRIAPGALVEAAEAAGVAAYAAVGLGPLALGKPYLDNVLPLGAPGDVLSSGTVWVLALAVALAVSAGVVLLLVTFVEETLRREDR